MRTLNYAVGQMHVDVTGAAKFVFVRWIKALSAEHALELAKLRGIFAPVISHDYKEPK